jgi:hypothetical protein
MARADVDMVEKEFQSTARVVTEGKREENTLKKGVPSTAADGADAATRTEAMRKSLQIPGGRLPWGRKGTDTSDTAP